MRAPPSPRPPRPSRVDTRASRPERRVKTPRRERRQRQRDESETKNQNDDPIVFIDGEGRGRDPHRYTYLAAVDEFGELKGEFYDASGIGTEAALDFFLDLGVKRVFGFAIGYDLTKILTALPPTAIYRLNRPEERKRTLKGGKVVHDPVYWRNFRLDYMRGKLTIRRTVWDAEKRRHIDHGPRIILWDVFKFYQSKFVTALIDWKIATEKDLEDMVRMKDQRAKFNELSETEVRKYCLDECANGAQLVRRLIMACDQADLSLTQFYGAGSVAKALLKKHEVKQYMPEGKYPIEMRINVYQGFFGGRFEASRVGPVKGPVYNNDISSAYPYQMTRLPCLRCGTWRFARGEDARRSIPRARLALVHARVRPASGQREGWGPFPFRSEGKILFPKTMGGTWVWKEEFLAGQELFPGVEAVEAWIYEIPDSCASSHHPFKFIPEIYAERLRIGKEGPGIILKLGMNSGYGVCAQSVGAAQFQEFVWAGNITSNTRAQLLYAIAAAGDPWAMLMLATDGAFSTVPLILPEPEDTGTASILFDDGTPVADCKCKPVSSPRCRKCKPVRKPLGGWEEKVYKRGIFLVRPGIYFPLSPTPDELKDVKARGMSKSVLLENAPRLEKHFDMYGITRSFVVHGHKPASKCDCDEYDPKTGFVIHSCPCVYPVNEKGQPHIPCEILAHEHGKGIERFVGMNAGVFKPNPLKKEVRLDPDYGEWIDYPIVSSFSPLPKRERLLPGNRLSVFERMPGESAAYNKAVRSDEAKMLQLAAKILLDQADGDFAESADSEGVAE